MTAPVTSMGTTTTRRTAHMQTPASGRPLVELGARLARSGGRFRLVSVVAGCAVAVVVLTLAWELPEALYPVRLGEGFSFERSVTASMLGLLVGPVVALLLALGRLSSGTRDRRLASLALLGVGPRRLALVAAAENVLPAAVGALAGVLLYLVIRPLAHLLFRDVLAADLPVGSRLGLVVLGVVGLSVLLAIVSARSAARPLQRRSEAAPARPGWWRLAPALVALGLFAVLFAVPTQRLTSTTIIVLVFAAAAACILTVLLTTPLVSAWVARGLVRGAGPSTTLAGRSIQVRGPSTARRIGALGVAVFVTLCGLGFLGILEGDPVVAHYVRQMERGPQEIWVYADDGSDQDPAVVAEVASVPGVEGVVWRYPIRDASCGLREPCGSVFVGTCSELALVASVTGCRDDEAAWIETVRVPEWLSGYRPQVAPRDTATLASDDDSAPLSVEVELPGRITADASASRDRWVLPNNYTVFVPTELATELGFGQGRATLIAEGGRDVRERLREAAEAHGMYTLAEAGWDYQRVVSGRAAVWGLGAGSLAELLLVLALASIDEARESRRGRGRLVALGVPAAVLRRAQWLALAVPLGVSLAIAIPLGLVATPLLRHLGGEASLMGMNPAMLLLFLGLAAVGAAVVTLLTLPLTRSGVRAEDLRQE
ncbi:hypothetical protein [Salana multivorans]